MKQPVQPMNNPSRSGRCSDHGRNRSRQRNQNLADLAFDAGNYLLMSLVLVLIAYPLVYILSASFSDPLRVASGEMWLLPKGATLEGFERLFRYSEIWRGYANTIYYTVFGTFFNLLVTIPCAYALSRKDFVGRSLIMTLFVITMFFSGGLVPTYLVVRDIGLINNRWMMIVGGATSAYNVVVSRTFFATSIPYELQEAGRIDGCTNYKLFGRIILPLSKPILAVMAMFFGVGHWNEYFGAMIYLKDREIWPLQLILKEILIQSRVAAEMAMQSSELLEGAAALARISEMIKYTSIVVSVIPMMALYVYMQKYFVKGVMIGAIKG